MSASGDKGPRAGGARSPSVGSLFGIAATSSSDIWAVGDGIEHWDGRRWTVEPSPKLPLQQSLAAVATVSPTEVWAVGGSDIKGYVGSTVERYQCPVNAAQVRDGRRAANTGSTTVPPIAARLA